MRLYSSISSPVGWRLRGKLASKQARTYGFWLCFMIICSSNLNFMVLGSSYNKKKQWVSDQRSKSMQQIKFQYPIHIIASKQLGLEFYCSFHFPSNPRCWQKFFFIYEWFLCYRHLQEEKKDASDSKMIWRCIYHGPFASLPRRLIIAFGLTGCCHCCVIKQEKTHCIGLSK